MWWWWSVKRGCSWYYNRLGCILYMKIARHMSANSHKFNRNKRLSTTSMPTRSDSSLDPALYGLSSALLLRPFWAVAGYMVASRVFDALQGMRSFCSHFLAKQEISARHARPSALSCLQKNSSNRSCNPCHIATLPCLFPKRFAALSNANAPCFPFSRKAPTRASLNASRNCSTVKTCGLAW